MAVRQFWSALLNDWTWGYDSRIKGRRVHKIGFASKENAELALAIRRVKANERGAGIISQTARITVRQLVNARIKQIGDKTYMRKNAARILKSFLATLPDSLLVEEVKTAHLAKYRDARLSSGLKPQSVHREMADIYACLNSAPELFTELSEWRAPKRPKLKIPKGYRKATISREQIALILAELRLPKNQTENSQAFRARSDAADFFEVALLSLARKDEIRTLRWDDIFWKEKKLRIDSKKTDEEGIIFIPARLIELFERRKSGQNPESPFVFPSDRNPQRAVSLLPTHIVKRAAEKHGIPWGYDKRNGIVFHTTRHTAVTALIEAGYDLATVQSQSRHSTQQILMRYAHARSESRRETADALSALVAKVAVNGSDNSPDSEVSEKERLLEMAAKSKG
jgi:integrase